jgi:hypothetical protein
MKLFKRGTLSILVGVHNLVWHPFTVWRAWRYLYKRSPSVYELIAIICHDLGYWGKPDMDGKEGQTHPEGGANIAMHLAYWVARLRGVSYEGAILNALRIYKLSLFHSTYYAQSKNAHVSALYLPDKVCVLFDPPWFYKLRARLSGELAEYVENANKKREGGSGFNSPDLWLAWYRQRMHIKALAYLEGVEHQKARKSSELLHKALGVPVPVCECEICAEKK